MKHEIENETDIVRIIDRDYQSNHDDEASLYSEFSRDRSCSSTESHPEEGKMSLSSKKKIINALKSFVKVFEPAIVEKRLDVSDIEDNSFESLKTNDELVSESFSDSSSLDTSSQSDNSDCAIENLTSIQEKGEEYELGGLYSKVNITTAWSDIIQNFKSPKKPKSSDRDYYTRKSSMEMTGSEINEEDYDDESYQEAADIESAQEIVSLRQPSISLPENVETTSEKENRSAKYKLRNPFKAFIRLYKNSWNVTKVSSHVSEVEPNISELRSNSSEASNSNKVVDNKMPNSMDMMVSHEKVAEDLVVQEETEKTRGFSLNPAITIEKVIPSTAALTTKHVSEKIEANYKPEHSKNLNESHERPVSALNRFGNMDSDAINSSNIKQEIPCIDGQNQEKSYMATKAPSVANEEETSSINPNATKIKTEKAMVKSGGRTVVISVCQLN
jgi:hypothetical protein